MAEKMRKMTPEERTLALLEQLKRLRERLEYDAAERKWLRQHMGW